MGRELRSMTGLGRGTAEHAGLAVTAEVKCVNGRHLELRLRLPRELQGLEPALRAVASSHFQRGQVEVVLRVPSEGMAAPVVEIDQPAARRYAEAGEQLRAELGLGDSLTVADLLGLPGVARLREAPLDTEAFEGVLRAALEEACRAAADMRAREGESLAVELEGRLSRLEGLVAEIEARAGEVSASLRERLDKRLATLAPRLELDPGRLEQEVVIYADRMDVTEELVRLRSHLGQFRETLEEPGPAGRKLEFLLQELGREVNTIGSKASDVPITRTVVALKSEFEKLREQVLNVE